MREVLFRGKIPGIIDWVYGYYAKSGDDHFILLDTDSENKFSIVDPQTVGQYTGLKDKNGTKIFEGDICETYFESYTHSWKEVGVVTEFCGAYGIESADGKHFRAFINESVYTRSYEVIGNIHDNPELLEVEK